MFAGGPDAPASTIKKITASSDGMHLSELTFFVTSSILGWKSYLISIIKCCTPMTMTITVLFSAGYLGIGMRREGVREIIGLYLYNYIIIYKYKILNSPFLPQKGGAENKTVIVIVIAYARLKQ